MSYWDTKRQALSWNLHCHIAHCRWLDVFLGYGFGCTICLHRVFYLTIRVILSLLQDEKIATILKAANVDIEPYWPGLFAKALEGIDVKSLITSIGSGVGSGGGAPAAAAGGAGAAPAAAEKKEEKKEEEPEESDDDMGFGKLKDASCLIELFWPPVIVSYFSFL